MLKSYSSTNAKIENPRRLVGYIIKTSKEKKGQADHPGHFMIRVMEYTWTEKKIACAMRAELLY